jgi:acyl-CoA thioesterase-1
MMRNPIRTVVMLMMSLMAALVMSVAQAQTASTPPGSRADRILILGDSLSAEYGLERGKGWVALLEKRLSDRAAPYEVINASVSGETTSGGLTRLPALLEQHRPQIVMIELGGNDGLRGFPPAQTEANLREMTTMAREAGARVVIAGMQLPPNYGRAYTERFQAMFADIARQEDAVLVPFLLEGIATDETLFQADRIHPTAAAQPVLLDNVWSVLEPLL